MWEARCQECSLATLITTSVYFHVIVAYQVKFQSLSPAGLLGFSLTLHVVKLNCQVKCDYRNNGETVF